MKKIFVSFLIFSAKVSYAESIDDFKVDVRQSQSCQSAENILNKAKKPLKRKDRALATAITADHCKSLVGGTQGRLYEYYCSENSRPFNGILAISRCVIETIVEDERDS